jgi:hypothetical protein
MRTLLLLSLLLAGCTTRPVDVSYVRVGQTGTRGVHTTESIPVSDLEVEMATGVSRYAPPEQWAAALNQFSQTHANELQ